MAVDVLVTGASGVLGREVVQCLRRDGLTVVACSRIVSPDSDAVWDVSDREAPEPECMPRAVVHAAARTGKYQGPLSETEALLEVNVTGALRVAMWCAARNVKRLVLISSAIVYGQWDEAPKRESDPPRPWLAGPYAVSKLGGELVVQLLAGAGCAVSIVRLSSLYGAGYRDGLILKLLREGQATGRITVGPPLDDAFDLLHVTDAARTVARATIADMTGLWNVGSGRLCILAELVQECAKAVGAEMVASGQPATRQRRILNWLNDKQARRDLQHSNQTDLAEGIRKIVQAMAGNSLQPGQLPRN